MKETPTMRRILPMSIMAMVCVLAGRAAGATTQPSSQPSSQPAVPRIDYVAPAARQPHENARPTIWYDDFNGDEKTYTESSGGLDSVSLGGAGKSMLCLYEQGKQGSGNRKVFFGDSPTGKVVAKGRTFDEIYWRIYIRHCDGWTGGGPDKMSRATSIVSGRWNQAMIAHVWSSGESLTLDPASGVRGAAVVTTKYNDFDNLYWLGNKPVSTFKIHSPAQTGWWVCVESRAKLNTPGKADGVNQLWIDGRLECERKNLDWRGAYAGHGLNAVFLEAYWNKGSPITQRRWYDNFVIATEPIGPVVCPPNPRLVKTPFRGAGRQQAWEAQVSADADGKDVVWSGRKLSASATAEAAPADNEITVGPEGLTGSLKGKEKLADGGYFCRVREQGTDGQWSQWSPWHQHFAVGAQPAATQPASRPVPSTK